MHAAGEIDWSRALIDASYVQAKKGAPGSARARSTAVAKASSTTSWLGRERWFVERTISHLHNKRRLLVRTDRSHLTHALLSVAGCLLCYARLRNSFC